MYPLIFFNFLISLRWKWLKNRIPPWLRWIPKIYLISSFPWKEFTNYLVTQREFFIGLRFRTVTRRFERCWFLFSFFSPNRYHQSALILKLFELSNFSVLEALLPTLFTSFDLNWNYDTDSSVTHEEMRGHCKIEWLCNGTGSIDGSIVDKIVPRQ